MVIDLEGRLPTSRRSKDVGLDLFERWQRIGGAEWLCVEYSYEFRSHEIGYRRAFHRHDEEYFVRMYGVATHEHCEATMRVEVCGHYSDQPVSDAFDGFRRLYDTWLTDRRPDCLTTNLWVMKRTEQASQARRELDRRFRTSDFNAVRARPRAGWVKAIRTALGMSQAVLARRLGISAPAVSKLERAETNGGITLTKLAEIGAALDCTVVYALVPNSSLEQTVQRQAHRVATAQLGYVAGTMALEDQGVSADRRDEYLAVYAHDVIGRGDLWREDPTLSPIEGQRN